MEGFFFLKKYIKDPKRVGAVLPSSKNLAYKMVEDIDFENSVCIVEYGPGTGSFTEELIKRRKAKTLLLLIEHNKEFCQILKQKYKNQKNFIVINDGAENVSKYLKIHNISKVDYIVSGLPFASLPKETSSNILSATKDILDQHGKFVTFQYTLFKKSFIKKWFKRIDIKYVIINVPPAFVFICSNSLHE
ncbi:UNVERIFIED_CONTAM: phospholipid N-methyltransferase [Acetivibrio alkalicellulosi]